MKIVTDSSVMFSVEDGARRGMTVLPLVVAIDGQTWLEYEDISAEEFLAKVRAGALPQSASPPPALTLAAYDTDDEVIHPRQPDIIGREARWRAAWSSRRVIPSACRW